MHIIWQLLVGLIIGAIAGFLLPGRESLFGLGGAWRWLAFAIVGFVGSLLGTFIGRLLKRDENYTAGWIMSILGAVVLLLIVRFAFG